LESGSAGEMNSSTMADCDSWIGAASNCPCQPFPCLLLPKTFRSAGTCTEPLSSPSPLASVRTSAVESKGVTSPARRSRPEWSSLFCGFPVERAKPAAVIRPSGNSSPLHVTKCPDVRPSSRKYFPTTAVRSQSDAACLSPNVTSVDLIDLNTGMCSSFNSTFNPCYTSSTPPDEENCGGANCGAYHQYELATTPGLPVLPEMTESCFEGIQADKRLGQVPLSGGFRPASWAGPSDGIPDHSSFMAPGSPSAYLSKRHEDRTYNRVMTRSRTQTTCQKPSSPDSHYYWELEFAQAAKIASFSGPQPTPALDVSPKMAIPLRMGTLVFSNGEPSKEKLAQVSGHMETLSGAAGDRMTRVPKMGRCLPARSSSCNSCSRVHDTPLASKLLPPGTVLHGGKCTKHRRCPTPPCVLSPCVDGSETAEVAVADI
jgi:hypothetical protein